MVRRASEDESERIKDDPGSPSNWIAGDFTDPDRFLQQFPEFKDRLKHLFQHLGDMLISGEDPARALGLAGALEGIPQFFGDFKIIREIGSGGMATVYEAEQISLKRRVALKVLPSYLSYSSKAVRKFQREAEAGGRQTHPGIVLTYAVGKYGKIHYIAEEFVEGGNNLALWLEERKKEEAMPRGYFQEAATLIAEVADALSHAHTSGVIHRDVKPSNILLTPEFKPKVTDFGLAMVEGRQNLSSSGDFFGTFFYMSPEQAIGSRSSVDHRTDVYSLGVTLFECLTLERPFEGATRQMTLQKILHSEPRDPAQMNKRVPRDLATVCLKAMDRDPGRRYASMADFGEDLRRYLGGEAILARPAGPARRLMRRIKRNPVLSGVSALALLAVSALVLYVLWSYPRILAERDGALRAQIELEKEANKTRTINRFLEEMFSSPNPGVKNRNVKVADVLDRASEEADRTLEGQPESEASLRCTLGRTYYSIGLYGKAREQFESAVEISADVLGEEHPDTLDRLGRLAATLRVLGELEESEAMYGKVVKHQERILGKEHSKTLQSKHNMATTLIYRGDLAGAASMLREVIEVRRRVLGDENPDTRCSMINLSNLLLDLCRYGEAEVLLRDASRILEQELGEEHPDTIGSLVNLTYALTEQHKFDEARPLARKCLEMSRRVLGKDHPKSFVAECTLANLHMAEKKYPDAETVFRDVMKRQRRVLGRTHPDALVPAIYLGHILSQQGKDGEAEEYFREAGAIADRTLPDNHLIKATLHTFHGDFLLKKENYGEAEEMLLKGLAVFEAVIGIDGRDTQDAIRSLICLYEAWGRPDEADEFRKKLSSTQDGQVTSTHPP